MSSESEDQLCAAALGMSPEVVGNMRNAFYQQPTATVMLWLFEHRLAVHKEEYRRKLEGCTEADLKLNQGHIKGLSLAITCLKN